MAPVTEQSPDRPEDQTGSAGSAGSGGPAGSAPDPANMDPEQWRQFQEFQRFQEYLRFTESRTASRNTELAQWTPTQLPVPDQQRSPVPYQGAQQAAQDAPTPPHGQPALHQQLAGMQQQLTEISKTQQAAERRANPPLWLKILRNKWLHRLVVLAILLSLGPWLVTSLITDDSSGSSGTVGTRPAPPDTYGAETPLDSVTQLYSRIYELGGVDNPRELAVEPCKLAFDDQQAMDQFASTRGAGSCPEALAGIAKQVDPKATTYGPSAPLVPELVQRGRDAAHVTISSCAMRITGGPSLGKFELLKYPNGMWSIERVTPEGPCANS